MVWSCFLLSFYQTIFYCFGYLFFCNPFPFSLPENETTLHLMMLTWYFSSTLPLALIPIPSLLIFGAKDTTLAGVLSLDIGFLSFH